MATKKVTKKASPKKKAAQRHPSVARVTKAAPERVVTDEGRRPVVATRGRLLGIPTNTPAQRAAKLRATMSKINEKHKGNVVVPADEASSNSYLRRPCGIMQIDIDTGGGMPAQSFVTIGGPDNSGKSSLLYCYFAMHQRLYGEESYIALANSEGNIDYLQARRCGWIVPVPMDYIKAQQQEREARGVPLLTKEEIAELRRSIGTNTIVEATTMEDILDVTEDLLATNLYGIVGIDSYEGLSPKAELALDSLDDHAQQALRANNITRFFQHYGPIKRSPEHFTTLMMTTQVRSNRSKANLPGPMQKYAKDWSDDTSAWALKHWRSIHMKVYSGGKIYEGPKSGQHVVGKEVNWDISKGKDGAHDGVKGSTSYYYDARCFDPLRSVIVAGFRYGVVVEQDGLLTFMNNGTPDTYLCRIAGPDQFIQAMQEEPESEWQLRSAILAAANVSGIYR
jgi:RecA/RadA recombinase